MPSLSESGKTLTPSAAPGCRITAFRGGNDANHWRLGVEYRGRVASVRVTDAQRAMCSLLNDIMLAVRKETR